MTFSGRAQICLGDPTSHGGKVVSGSPTMSWNGIPLARKGDKVSCPKCKPFVFEIAEGFGHCTDNGVPLAMEGHRTTCGAELMAPAAAAQAEAGAGTQASAYDEQIQALESGTGRPLAGVAYFIEAEDGRTFFGETDADGLCPRIETASASELKVWFGISAVQKSNEGKK